MRYWNFRQSKIERKYRLKAEIREDFVARVNSWGRNGHCDDFGHTEGRTSTCHFMCILITAPLSIYYFYVIGSWINVNPWCTANSHCCFNTGTNNSGASRIWFGWSNPRAETRTLLSLSEARCVTNLSLDGARYPSEMPAGQRRERYVSRTHGHLEINHDVL